MAVSVSRKTAVRPLCIIGSEVYPLCLDEAYAYTNIERESVRGNT